MSMLMCTSAKEKERDGLLPDCRVGMKESGSEESGSEDSSS